MVLENITTCVITESVYGRQMIIPDRLLDPLLDPLLDLPLIRNPLLGLLQPSVGHVGGFITYITCAISYTALCDFI